MYKKEINQIIKEFENFTIPSDNFTGGRFQTSCKYFFAHINSDGKLMKIEVNKPGGSIFYIKVEK